MTGKPVDFYCCGWFARLGADLLSRPHTESLDILETSGGANDTGWQQSGRLSEQAVGKVLQAIPFSQTHCPFPHGGLNKQASAPWTKQPLSFVIIIHWGRKVKWSPDLITGSSWEGKQPSGGRALIWCRGFKFQFQCSCIIYSHSISGAWSFLKRSLSATVQR